MDDKIAPCSDNYFTQLAKYYDVTHQWRDYERQSAFLLEIVRKYRPDSKRVLDIACGTGEHARRLSSSGYKVTAIDNSREMLDIAARKNRKLSPVPEWVLSDLLTLQSFDPFDVIYCLGMTIHYIYSPDRLVSFLSGVSEKLHTGGIFILDIISPWQLLEWAPSNHFFSKDTSQQIYILERSEIDRSSRIRHNDYTWFVKDTKSDWCQYELFENLKVWFIDEIEYFLEKTGLKLISKCSDYDLTRLNLEKDFNVVFVTRGS
jgi:SAM-dependent methyltransferase